MKLRCWTFILVIGVFTACQNNQSAQKDKEKIISGATEQSCYTYTKNKDTASLMLIISGRIITGELHYQLFEKDSNKGIIKGEMRGDTLVADYIFNSEGKQSTRQVAFLRKNGKLIEGSGEVTEKNGKVYFRSTSDLKFGDAIEFTKVSCK
ncbi:MAG: hypothetical protein H7202_04070 [Pedobacter sp.]|nr:hypothetical protein [Pedobacter sp.]